MARRPERAVRGLAGCSSEAIQAELRRRTRMLGKLQKKRATLAAKLAKLDREIVAAGGMPRAGGGGGGRGRARNSQSLVEALAVLLKDKTMNVTDAAEAVQRAGYQTSSPNFRTMVNQALLKKDVFKRVGRGQYTAK